MKFVIGKKKYFFDFLNSINQEDKIAILTHNDLDGIASAIFTEKILSSKNLKKSFVDFLTYKKDMYSERIQGLKEKGITRIILTDLNENSDLEGFKRLNNEFEIFMIDHHPIMEEVKDYKNILKTKSESKEGECASQIVYELGKDVIDEEKYKWLICSAIIADYVYQKKENLEFIQKFYPKTIEEKIMESVPGKITITIGNAIIYFQGKLHEVYDLVKKGNLEELKKYENIIEGEIQKTIKEFHQNAEYYPDKNLYFYFSEPKFNIGSIVSSILSNEDENKIIILSTPKDDMIKISARNQSGKIDLNKFLKKGIQGLENAVAGGHAKASGASFMKKDLDTFKKNILK